MNKRNYKYAEMAAGWWADQIRSTSEAVPMRNLTSFEEFLAERIHNIVSQEGQMNISTFKCRSNLLDEIAYESRISTSTIPIGFEMRIIMCKVYVYDSIGNLVVNF